MNLKNSMLGEISQAQQGKFAWFHLFEASAIVRFMETESRMVVRGPGDVKMGIYV